MRPRRTACWIIALALAGCGACRPGPVARPYPAPAPAELLQVMTARQQAVRAVNARVRATSWLGGERVRATVLMLIERAGKLRFEAEINLQGTVAVLVTDGTDFSLLDVNKNVLSRGPACPENVASLIRIPLQTSEVAAILLGDVALQGAAEDGARVAWDDRAGADVLELPAHGGTLRIMMKHQGNGWEVVGAVQQDAAGTPVWRTSYEDLTAAAGGVRLPQVIRYAEGKRSFDDGVEIKFKDRELNPAIPETSFRLATPAGIREQQVGCGPPPAGGATP